MMPVNILSGEITIKNIETNDLSGVYDCVNESIESLKAMGRESKFLYEELEQRYLETLVNSLEIFCGVFFEDKIIGIIKGRIEDKASRELCILSFILQEKYRGKGIGSSILDEFEKYFLHNFAVKKFCGLLMEYNRDAKKFWLKNGYKVARVTRLNSRDKEYGILIMEKGR